MRSAVAAPGDTRDNHRGDNGSKQGRQCVILSVRVFMRFKKSLKQLKVAGFCLSSCSCSRFDKKQTTWHFDFTAFLLKTGRHLSLVSSPGIVCHAGDHDDDDEDTLGGHEDSSLSARDRSQSLPSPCPRTLRHFRMLRLRNTIGRLEHFC